MSATRRCPRCDAELSPDRPDGLCPACLMGAAVAPQEFPPGYVPYGSLAQADTVEAEPLPQSDPLPRIPRYRLLEPVGEGGMGVVYKAEQLAPVRRTVAIKLIKLGMDTKQVVARFESERQALALLSHPNVAAVYDGGATETGRPYFVMEWVPGEPITDFCDRHQYTTRQRLELFTQACEAVQHAHQKAIIHRDLKPSNILVMLEDGKPLVKVIDFGVAKATAQRLTDATLFTAHGQLIGTPEYMSPEQAEMNALDVDTRTDIYSLGVVLYELLTGAVPFDSRTLREAALAQVQRIIREVDPPRPSTRLSSMGEAAAREVARRRQTELSALTKQLRGELEWIPLKALRKDRGQRYSTASELAEDVRNYLANRPLVAGPESRVYRARKFLRRNKGPVAAAATVLVVLLAGVTVSTWQAVRIKAEQRRTLAEKAEVERQRAEAQRQQQRAEQQAAIAQAANGFLEQMLSSADPHRMLGEAVTVMQAISASIRELDSGILKNQPLVEATVRSTIGNTLRSLGRSNDALAQLKRAMELWRRALPPDDPDIATSLDDLAQAHARVGDDEAAERLHREAVEVYRRALPPDHNHTATAMNNLGVTLTRLGRFDEAEPVLRAALEMRQRVLPAGHAHLAVSRQGLANLLLEKGDLSGAESLLREALALARAALPSGHPDVAAAATDLALLLRAQGKHDASEGLFREALEIFRAIMPAGHERVARAINNLASVLQSQGKLEEAEPLFREALAVMRDALPPGHRDVGLGLNNLALLLHERGNLAEAEPFYIEALAIYRNALPHDHPDVAFVLNNLAMLYVEHERYADAERLHAEALERRRAALPADHPHIALTLANFAVLRNRQGKPAEAEALLREALQIYRKSLPADHPLIARCLCNLATVVDQQGRSPDAENLLRDAIEIYKARKNDEQVAIVLAQLVANGALAGPIRGRSSTGAAIH